MQFINNNKLTSSILILFVIVISTPCQANFSEDVMYAMDGSNNCNKADQNHVYSECMLLNNQRLKDAILRISQQQLKKYDAKKKQSITENINRKIKSINRNCLNEQAMFGDSMNGERRHPYCIYENSLELLINIEQRIDIYAK